MSNKVISTFTVPISIQPTPHFQHTPLSLRKRETRFSWAAGKSTQQHSLGNKIKPLLSYLCPSRPWSSGGISPCTERKSCRWRQRPRSELGHKCEDPCRSGTSVPIRAGFSWATLQSVLLQSYSVLCWGQPREWHLQRQTSQSNCWCEGELLPSLLTPLGKELLKLFLTKKTLFTSFYPWNKNSDSIILLFQLSLSLYIIPWLLFSCNGVM